MSYECLINGFGTGRWRCGKCENCRKVTQQEKGLRLTHESQYWSDACFLTLTYNNENLPADNGLVKDTISVVIKRIRDYIPFKIKYAGCGEYGSVFKTNRPHYHIIIFGLKWNDPHVFSDLVYDHKKHVWRCKCKAWDLGFATIAPVNINRCFYVAKYCVKKLYGDLAEKGYHGRQPEFYITSKGIGERWIEDHKKLVKKDNFIRFNGGHMPIPRYYIDKVYSEYDKYKRNRLNYQLEVSKDKELLRYCSENGIDVAKYAREKLEQLRREYIRKARSLCEKGKLKNE